LFKNTGSSAVIRALIRSRRASIRRATGAGSSGAFPVGGVVVVSVVDGGEVGKPLGGVSKVVGGAVVTPLAGGVAVVAGLGSEGGEETGLVGPEGGDTGGVVSAGVLGSPAGSKASVPVAGGAAGKGRSFPW
jgi:hypothetical protein